MTDTRDKNKPSKTAKMKSEKKDYKVGYGKPPKKHRFKKGQSGNPKGRPKGSKNMATLCSELLSSQVTVTVNGEKHQLPYREAIVAQLGAKAIKGSMNDQIKFFGFIEHHLPQELQPSTLPSRMEIVLVESDGNGRRRETKLEDFGRNKASPSSNPDADAVDSGPKASETEELDDDDLEAAWKASGIDDEPGN